jgi:hypothetical protein
MTPNGPNLGEYEGMFPLILQPVLIPSPLHA